MSKEVGWREASDLTPEKLYKEMTPRALFALTTTI
jgi:hypothetical protein